MESSLINIDPEWRRYWTAAGMPEYRQDDLQSDTSLTVYFRTLQDREEFIKMVNPGLSPESKWTWWPPQAYNKWSKRPDSPVKTGSNKYPIYVISKGRWESRLTVKYLELLSIPFRLVIEPQELKAYEKVVDPAKILTLPFSNLGQGSIPARNWVWGEAVRSGAKKHWILDDNIQGFYCMNFNRKELVTNFNPFIPVEQFTDYFSNVGISGMNYEYFTQRRAPMAPYYLNTRVYSCILINHAIEPDIGEKWRGRYNEDTDLCLRALKANWCTILLNYVQAKKVTTMLMKGGNTDELYQGDGRKKMAESLKQQHPDVVEISHKWGRVQHHVDYRHFRKLRLVRAGI